MVKLPNTSRSIYVGGVCHVQTNQVKEKLLRLIRDKAIGFKTTLKKKYFQLSSKNKINLHQILKTT